jgi:aldehyde dehydrogenase (NAD+)
MYKLADLIESNVDDLAILETLAMGQPIAIAKHGAASFPAWWRYYAGWAGKIAGEVFPDDGDGVYRMVRYEPLGVCAGIASWNMTLVYTCWKMAPAVAAGNTFIFKASEKSPLGALKLASLVKEAGFPPGVINFVSGAGETGAALASHMGIAKISFTGSTNTGRKVQISAATSNLKRCVLELGGKSPALVFEDADIDNALLHMSRSFLVNAGQICAATSRLLVQDTIADNFITQLKTRFENMKSLYGDPTDSSTFVGPLADAEQYSRVMGFLEEGKKDGVEVLTGGERHGESGYFVQPTILLNPPNDSSVYKEEIFGPVLSVKTFSNEEEAVAMANDSTYGLGAAIFTSNVSRALRLSADLEAGSVGVNQPVIPNLQVPFGGVKQSGNGREGGLAGIMGYLESKTISVNVKV